MGRGRQYSHWSNLVYRCWETKLQGGGGIPTSSVAGGHAGGLTQNWRQRGRKRGEKTTKTFVIGSNWKEKLEIKFGVSMQSSCQFPGWKEKVRV